MTHNTRDFGQQLGSTVSIPPYIQAASVFGPLVLFATLWTLNVAPVLVLIGGTCGLAFALCMIARRIPALCSSLTIYENGLEMVVQGKPSAFAYDQLNCLAAKYTHHKVNHNYIGTRARIEFFVDGRFTPYIYDGEFRRDKRGDLLIPLAIEKCSQAIQHRLLAELEQKGVVAWRDNVSLTVDGIMLTDSESTARLIPYRNIVDWKIVDNDLKIWKAGDALPCLVLANDTPNFGPLFGLFKSLASATRNIDPTCASEPSLAALA
jgi:hypothetical protein